jgi:hypothetical protein
MAGQLADAAVAGTLRNVVVVVVELVDDVDEGEVVDVGRRRAVVDERWVHPEMATSPAMAMTGAGCRTASSSHRRHAP